MTNENLKQADSSHGADANRDPITGTPGAHPVGAGVGTAGGAVAGAAIGAVGGPIGAAVGLVAGGVAGGLAGKAVAENIDPSYGKSTGTLGLGGDKSKSATRDASSRVEKILPGDADGDGR